MIFLSHMDEYVPAYFNIHVIVYVIYPQLSEENPVLSVSLVIIMRNCTVMSISVEIIYCLVTSYNVDIFPYSILLPHNAFSMSTAP